MNFNDIVAISKNLKSQSISSMSFENGHMIMSDNISYEHISTQIFNQLEKGVDQINIESKDKDYFINNIPSSFSSYIHVNGNFYNIDYNNNIIYKVNYEDIPDKNNIFDISKHDGNIIYDTVSFISNILEKSIKEYYNLHTYNPGNYTITKKVEMPCSAYDHSFSLTKEESDKVSKWKKKHYKKYHKNEVSKATIAVSNFEIQFRVTSIGVYCDCVCKSCLEQAKQVDELGEVDLAKKLKKDAIFEVRGLE